MLKNAPLNKRPSSQVGMAINLPTNEDVAKSSTRESQAPKAILQFAGGEALTTIDAWVQ
jgi:hypothetical protein